MRKTNIGSIALSVREEYTSTALKRSTNIDNCAPDGYFNLIHAVVLAAYSGDPVPVSTIREKYNSGVKNSKDIMENCAQLTYQPFPIIESTKLRSIGSDEVTNSPLYDESTGNTVQERYSNVVLSELGRLLARHYRDYSISDIDSYNSIVPLSLFRRSLPWTMGHKGSMEPLNPSEIFKIIDKMLEINSPIIPEQFLLENFKGVDVGEHYTIFTNTKSLMRLYTRGISSIIAMPEIEIRRKENKIIIKRPPLGSTTRKLISYLRNKSIKPEQEQYSFFRFSPKVDMVGNEAHINITKFLGNNEQIMTDFLGDSRIAVKKYIKHEIITPRESRSNRSSLEEDSILGKPAEYIKLSDLNEVNKNLTAEDLEKINLDEFIELVQNYKVNEETTDEVSDKPLNTREQLKKLRNPYNFELDLMPVYEVLWRAILGERKLLQLGFIKKLEEERKTLEYDLLLEKATRPDVAKKIYELQPKNNRVELLLAETKKGSKLLEEGFALWEAEEIYKERGNDILPNIFKRDKFENLYKKTQARIKDLEDKINNPEILNTIIRKDIKPFIEGKKYQRKSEVMFIPDERMDDSDTFKNKKPLKQRISITSRYDNLDIPCTIFYNLNKIRRNYGVNMYFNDFLPQYELNTTNYSKIQIYITEGAPPEPKEGEPPQSGVKTIICMAKDIALDRTSVFGTDIRKPATILGIIPVEEGREFILWTSKGRFLRYTTSPGEDFGLKYDEIILGWEYADKQFLDIRGSNGIQTLEVEEFPKFKKGLKDLYDNMGTVYDMISKAKSDNVVRLRNTVTNRDYKKQRRVLWKSKYARPVDLEEGKYDFIFSPHRTRYWNGIYLMKWQQFGMSNHEKFLPPKKVMLTEYAMTDDNTRTTKKLHQLIANAINSADSSGLFEEDIFQNKPMTLIARFTRSYTDFDLEKFSEFNIIDERALVLYNTQQELLQKFEGSREEYQDSIDEEILSWSQSDETDEEMTELDKIDVDESEEE